MQDVELFKQVYDHIADKVKSFSISILLIASLLTNWDLLYFLVTSQYSPRETISIAIDVYFSPWHLIWVYLVLSAVAPIIVFSSKTLYNKVHIPLERIFNKHIKGIAYPDKEEYRKIVTQYEALEKSFKSGELYDDLKKEIDELKAQNASLERDKKALQETMLPAV